MKFLTAFLLCLAAMMVSASDEVLRVRGSVSTERQLKGGPKPPKKTMAPKKCKSVKGMKGKGMKGKTCTTGAPTGAPTAAPTPVPTAGASTTAAPGT